MQPRIPTHPAPEVLDAFGLGKLNDSDSLQIAEHLESCAACRLAVEQAPPDSFIGRVRGANPPGSGTQLPIGLSSISPVRPQIPQPTKLPTPKPSLPPDLPPELAQHPKFQILRELGRGGMGVVYKAQHSFMDILVALKVINKSLLDNADVLGRFDREVRAAAKLDHPHIVRALDADRAGDLRILVMDFVEGFNLQDVLEKKGPFPIQHACHYVRQAALGLQYAHEQGMVHRDIKPQNLILTPKGKVKILDFGLARLVSERKLKGKLTQLGDFMGTPHYMAPEQALDASQADIRADLYSLACTLYSLLTGNPPFHEETVVKLVMAHIEKEAPALDGLRPDVPPELAELMRRMLAKDPNQRYQTPIEMAQVLAPFCKAKEQVNEQPEIKQATRSALVPKESRAWSDTSQIPPIRRPVAQKGVPILSIPESPAALASPFAQIEESGSSIKKKEQKMGQVRASAAAKKWFVVGGIVTSVVLFGLVAMWAAGVFVKTKDGTIVLENISSDAEVLVDGEKVTVIWDATAKKAELHVRPGRRQIVAKHGGIQVIGEEVTIEESGHRVVTAHLKALLPELPAKTETQPTKGVFVPLFNGKDLTGWYSVNDFISWRFEKGDLIGQSNGQWANLDTKKNDYVNFHLRMETMLTDGGGAGLSFRLGPPQNGGSGASYIASIGNITNGLKSEDIFQRTGTLYIGQGIPGPPNILAVAKHVPLKENEWFPFEIIVNSNRIRVLVKEQTVVDYTDQKLTFTIGKIRLLNRGGTTELRFRNIEIKELRPE